MQQENPTFTIQAPGIDFETARLFAEAGPMGVSLAVLGNDNCIKAVKMYNFAAQLNESELAGKFRSICMNDNLLQQKYSKSHIFWSFAESILVPAGLMHAENNPVMLNLVFGDAKQGPVHSDFLFKQNLFNIYRLPETVTGIFSSGLPAAAASHSFSAMANRNFISGNHLFAVFYGNSLTIMLCSDTSLQIIQNFEFNVPDDCVFHLLNVCKGFTIQPDSVILHIMGMIDESSALYAAVYKYFLNIELEKLPENYTYTDEIKNMPPHFFSHLFFLASCG